VFASPAVAAPPVLTSVRHVDSHPAASWTLSPGVTPQVAEVATAPATSTDGFLQRERQGIRHPRAHADELGLQLPARPRVYYLHVAGAGRALLLRWPLTRSRVHADRDLGDRGASASTATSASACSAASLRGQRSLHPPRRDPRPKAELDVPRRYRAGRLPQRSGASLRRPPLPGLLHEEPPPSLPGQDDSRTLLGRLAAADPAAMGGLRERPLSPVGRVHVAD
jgi:hypothetical protein